MTCITILEGNIGNNLWPKDILPIAYIKNICVTKA